MQDVRIAAVQFPPVAGDIQANLDTVARLAGQAAQAGAEIVCFPECCLSGYNLWSLPGWTERADGDNGPEPGRIMPAWQHTGLDPYAIAQPVPDGPAVRALMKLAAEQRIVIGAGLVELRPDNACYNTYVLVGPNGYIGRYSKCHLVPGIEYAYFRAGESFPVFDLGKVRAGVLICYDNHFPEAHRILAAKGAEVILMPHVTAGKGWWHDLPLEAACRQAKNWVLTWLRARAFDNECYVVFVNEASDDSDKAAGALGCSMVLDPDGSILAQAATPGEEIVTADLSAKQFYVVRSRQHDYLNHRRPELYGELTRRDLGPQ